MSAYQLLEQKQHAQLKFNSQGLDPALAESTNCSITASELFAVSAGYPVVFLKDEHTGQLVLSCLLCLTADKNLFYNQGQWDAPYTPLNIKRQPFAAQVDGENPGNFAVMFNAQSRGFTDQATSAVFDDQGQPSPEFKIKLSALEALVASQKSTDTLIEGLNQLELITPLTIRLTIGDAEHSVAGLYGIDINRLNLTNSGIYEQLTQAGILEEALLIKASYAQLGRLVWMENKTRAQPITKYALVPAR